ncbi:uncharacterized mitochondrial protein AtMg00820-like [Carya illinoinensis]|uniref:uncharacterized mitochondrial protein AtMg00820-like n=1 Tax=Carya illinoinensis TaxID=32201 RepID=UPI001C71B99B|nr:uncharacterized mitochondrial protein AtMg00820-like [Carya illinoinensis]
MLTRSKTNIFCPLRRNDGTISWPSCKPTMSLTTSSVSTSPLIPEEPTSFIEVSKFVEWHTAMATEIDALLSNKTWDLVPFSPSYNLLGSKWVLKTKRKSDGSLECCKLRSSLAIVPVMHGSRGILRLLYPLPHRNTTHNKLLE